MSDLKIYLRRGKMRQSHNSWLPDTPAKTTPTRFLNSHICDAIRMEDASLADFIQDYKSARAMASSPGPVPQCDNVYLIEPSPTSFDIPAPAMSSTPLRSISHICDESLIMFYPMGGNNETGTQGASLEDPIHDPSILPCPVSAPQCDDNAKSIEPWPSFYIPIPAMSTPLKSNETRMEGASFDDSIHDQESATISISPDPVPHCDDNSKSIEPSPSFYIPMSTPLRSNETGMEGASLADPIHDLESATISIIPGPLHDPSILSDPVPQCDEISKSIEPSPSFYIPIPAMSTPLKSDETRMEGASLDDSILDQESATISILPDPVPHCDDNSKSIEPSPSFYIPMSTPLRSNEIGMEGASLADPIHDQESATISIIPGPLHDPSILPDPVPQCDEISESIEPSPSFYIPIPAMSTPLKSNETGTEGASLADSIYDQESATIGIIPYPRSLSIDLNSIPTESLLNCDIPTIANSTLLEPSSHICNESSVISVPMCRNDEIGNGGASLADPVHDQESETISIVPTPSSLQCEEDVNGKPIETIPSIGIPTPASKDRKKKNNGQDYDTPRPQKRPKKKVYWPKVIGQSKRKRKAPETSTNESKTKKRRVSVVNGDGKPKRTPKSKTAKKVEVEESTTPKVPSTPEEKITSGEGKTLSHSSKTKSTKRSLKFELEENIEEFPHAPNWLEELGCKSNYLQLSTNIKIPQKKRSRRCDLLHEVRKIGPNFPKASKKKRIQKLKPLLLSLKPLFQSIKKGKRLNNRRRRTNLNIAPICSQTSLSKHVVKGKREKKLGVNKKITRNKKTQDEEEEKLIAIPGRKLAFVVKKFQSLDLNYWNKELVLYKNQDKRLVLPKGKKKVPVVKINLDERSLKMWNFLMDDKPYEESEEDQKYWEQERDIYLGRVKAFTARMHLILGDRSFSAWKGSVLDSVIGVFLTQNVSDHLSSSAYMSLAAKFPIKTSSSGESDKNDDEVRVNNSSKVNERVYDSLHLKRRKAEPQSKKLSQEDQEKITKEKKEAEEKEMQYWESLRKTYVQYCSRNSDHKSLVDWEAVRWADVKDVAKAIEGRGQHNIIALNIQIFLNRLVEMHGTIDLEWLRHAPPDEVKKYLLQVEGLGLKSVECIRLLALQHRAFPVDVNVGRIAVRLGWVPLEPLPESLPIHLLEQFPSTNVVQQYLWPRLCALDQPTLYELHYQLITFGKVFCTKLQPNCNMCPMRGECLHFESAYASAKPVLPGPTDSTPSDDSTVRSEVAAITISEWDNKSTSETKNCEPIIEMPASPISECAKVEETDIEDFYKSDDSDEVMTINLSAEEPMKTAYNYFDQDDMNMSRALVALSENARSLPARKMKSVKRLRTERMVYVLPDTHPLLVGFKMREAGDPSPYLLVIWSPGELESSSDPCKNVSDDSTLSCKDAAEENNQTMPGTILIPCRTAMDGRFPLNGTYFQVNEVFADAETSKNPIDVPRNWIWNLQTQTAYFGTSTTTILRGTSLEEIHKCFWRGFVCVRGFDRKTGAPRPLAYKFHISTTTKQKMKKDEKADTKLGLER